MSDEKIRRVLISGPGNGGKSVFSSIVGEILRTDIQIEEIKVKEISKINGGKSCYDERRI